MKAMHGNHHPAPGMEANAEPGTDETSNSASHDSVDASKTPRSRWWHRQKTTLPSWLDHFNSHDLKTLFRCCVAVWVATLLIFIRPALDNIGQATFFAALVLYASPPVSILFLYILASFSLLLGMCLAWAWGLLAMKAALAARPEVETQTRLESLQQEAVAAANRTGQAVAWEAQKLVHDGHMLDIRVTVIFFVFSCIFIYTLARLRASNPKLVLTQIFGTITMDLFCLYGPTLPKYTPALASVLIKPGAVGTAIGLACCLLLFPHSTSYVVLDKLEKLVLMSETPLVWTREHLAQQPPDLVQLVSAKRNTIEAYKATEPLLAFLPLDFARCRWNADDVKALQERVRKVMLSSLSLVDLHIAKLTVNEKKKHSQILREAQRTSTVAKDLGKEGSHGAGHRQMMETAELMEALNYPSKGWILNRATSALQETTAEVIESCSQSMKLVARCIHTANTCRWFQVPSQAKFDDLSRELEEKLVLLRSAGKTCATNTTAAILDVHADLFGEDGQLKPTEDNRSPAVLEIVTCMVVEERILSLVGATQDLLDQTLLLTKTRKTHRIWIPTRLQYAVSWVLDGKVTVPFTNNTSSNGSEDPDSALDPAIFQDQVKEAHQRLRVVRGYEGFSKKKKNLVSRAIIGAVRWLTCPGGMYALRMVAVTIATGVPAVIGHSAGFYYREKGLWVTITAQTCVLVYMADFTLSIFARLAGTILGGVLGLIAWYIGSGSGPGNPYGLGAITAFTIIPIVFCRIFLPLVFTTATILAGATFSLIIGYSYDHHHIQQYGLPGQGAEAFWKRVVSVLLGFVAAFVVQIIPRPPSATRHVCNALANAVRTLADHYALLLSHWARSEPNPAIGSVGEQISLDLAEALFALNGPVEILKLELTSSPFDTEVLRKTKDHCHSMNHSLRRLLELATALPKELQDRLVNAVGILDNHIIGDIMAVLGLIEQSLRTGSPLPERTPAPLVRVFFEAWRARTPSIMLSVDLVRDEDYRRYCVGVSAYLQFLSTIDDLVLVLKAALGECHVIQLEEA